LPIAQGDDVFTVVPATLPETELTRRVSEADSAVIIKLGRNLGKVRRALDKAKRLEHAIYVERGTMRNSVVMQLTAKQDEEAPYLAVVLVPGWGARA
jgi:precorrin-2/cobalt-factor-2 C20-methyltransferase